eukprot:COSAG06_NODE_4455_length_4245_cov_9.320550_7_plen_235_part_00
MSHALPSGCAASELKVCVAAHSGRGGLIPLGSICAPQCPAGFVNTSIFCPKAPTGTEVALDCLFHMNPVKPNEPGFNKTCACPGPKTQTNPDGCTCLSGCAMEGCATDAACGGGRVCNKRSQFHVCLYPWDTQACGAGVEDLTDEMARPIPLARGPTGIWTSVLSSGSCSATDTRRSKDGALECAWTNPCQPNDAQCLPSVLLAFLNGTSGFGAPTYTVSPSGTLFAVSSAYPT